MIISNQQVQSILSLQNSSLKKQIAPKEDVSSNKVDTLELSGRMVEFQQVKDQVLKSSEVRTDKIGNLKQQIQQGGYQISGTEIASKIISRSLVDELAGR